MTTHVVADDILGKLTRKFWEMLRRVLEGSIMSERASFFLQRALESPSTRRLPPGPGDVAVYLLQCRWSYDKRNYEFATISLEWGGDGTVFFEDLFKPDLSSDNRTFLMNTLQRLYNAQIPDHGSRKMLRLYRVLNRHYFGIDDETTENAQLRDIHFSLELVCEFGENGELIQPAVR